MRRVFVIVAVLVGVAALVVVFLPKQHVEEVSTKLAFATIKNDIKNGAALYDVRTTEEYGESHFEGAVNWPLQDMEAGTLPEVAKSTKIYLYCRSGNRSAQATKILKKAGFTAVTDLGGISDVRTIGGQLITH